MPNTDTDLQVTSETVEPYRALMIFRTLHEGQIVFKGGKTKIYPAQTFYCVVNNKQLPQAFGNNTKGDQRAFVAFDLEGVKGLIDQYAPGTGNIAPAV